MPSINGKDVKRVVIACEAGMGSSVMLTSQLSRQLKPLGVEVTHSPVNAVNDEAADLVICHQGLAGRARHAAPATVIVPFQLFLGDPVFSWVVTAIRDGATIDG